MTQTEALKLALEALERGETELRWKAITAIREALAQPEQDYLAGVPPMFPQMRDGETIVVTEYVQPEHSCVACEGNPKGNNNPCAVCGLAQPEQEPFGYFRYDLRLDAWVQNRAGLTGTPFYTSPPHRKPLTDEEIGRIAGETLDPWSCARAIEAAHGIKE